MSDSEELLEDGVESQSAEDVTSSDGITEPAAAVPTGPPPPTEEELAAAAAAAQKAEEEAAAAAALAAQIAAEQAAAEAVIRAKAEANSNLRRAAVLLEDAILIEASSAPIRSYLMENVIPALVDGLLDVCKIQPDDPVDYLAEYLFKYSVDQPLDQENAQNRPQL